MTVDVAVLGAGVSGLSVARRMADEGRSVVVLDEYPAAGGNHISTQIDGMEFDIGAIYFHSEDRQFALFPELLERCRPMPVSQAKVNVAGRITRFPFDLGADIPPARRPLVLASLAEAYARRLTVGEGATADSFIRARIGSALYAQSGLTHYMARFFGTSPAAIDVDFARRRLGWIARQSSVRWRLQRLRARGRPLGGRSLARLPGGFGPFYTAVTDRLAADGVAVRLGERLAGMSRQPDGTLRIDAAGGVVDARRVVSTIPIARAAELAGVTVPALPHAALLSLFVEVAGAVRTKATIVYNFHPEAPWKRFTLHSRLYAPEAGRIFGAVEVPLRPGMALPDPAAVFAEVAAHMTGVGLVDGTLRLAGSHHLPTAYPVPVLGYMAARDAALAALAERGIESLGRQGAFAYLPSSSVAVREALAALEPEPAAAR